MSAPRALQLGLNSAARRPGDSGLTRRRLLGPHPPALTRASPGYSGLIRLLGPHTAARASPGCSGLNRLLGPHPDTRASPGCSGLTRLLGPHPATRASSGYSGLTRLLGPHPATRASPRYSGLGPHPASGASRLGRPGQPGAAVPGRSDRRSRGARPRDRLQSVPDVEQVCACVRDCVCVCVIVCVYVCVCNGDSSVVLSDRERERKRETWSDRERGGEERVS
jgi:hypothetical protein